MVTSCRSFEPFSISRQEFVGNHLKLDGYYYSLDNNKNRAFFLYRNGIYHNRLWDGFGYYITNIDSLDKQLVKSSLQESKYPTQYSWGIFNVVGSTIRIERWLAGVGGPYPTQMLIGEIKNDTTLYFHTQIGDSSNSGGKKKTYKIDDIYHFRQFSPKPDSINSFIK